MTRIGTLIVLLAIVFGQLTNSSARAADTSRDEAEIRKNAETYAAAFDRRDAKALAAMWAPEAVYTSPVSGKKVHGREAIRAELEALFKQSGRARLVVKIDSVRFVGTDTAVEEGSARISRPGEAPAETEYSAIHVKKEGKWLLDSIQETDLTEPSPPYEHLKDLEWLVGQWGDNDDRADVKVECKWTANRAFLTRSFSISIEGGVEMEGTQIIGWDPAKKQIRSWAFDSDGGFAEGTWKRDGDRWVIRSVDVLPDGGKGTSTNILRMIDNDHFGWKSIAREIDGELLSNIDEVEVVRQ
jgi:uncharacterized protein (TIGR02246 family)